MELTEAELSFVNACLREQEERKLYKTAYVKPKYGVHDFCSDSENVLKTALLRGLNFRSDSLFLRSLVKRIMFLARKWEFRERKENAVAEQLRIATMFAGRFGGGENKKEIGVELAHIFGKFNVLSPSRITGNVIMCNGVFAQALRYQNAFKQIRILRAMAKEATLQSQWKKKADEIRPMLANIKGPDQNAGLHGGNVSGTASRFLNRRYANKSSGGGYW